MNENMDGRQKNTAELYRMVTPEHVCPFGLKSKDLLEQNHQRAVLHF